MLLKIAIPNNELHSMTYLSDMIQTCDSKEIDVFYLLGIKYGQKNCCNDSHEWVIPS